MKFLLAAWLIWLIAVISPCSAQAHLAAAGAHDDPSAMDRAGTAPTIAVIPSVHPRSAQGAQQPAEGQDPPAADSLHWESSARMHRADLFAGDHGTFLIDRNGLEFRARNGHTLRWTFGEVHTFLIAPHHLVLETYLNRSLHWPGERTYRLRLAQAVPPAVAARLAEAVARPSRNADPNPKAPAIAAIPARHRALSSGTNGVLRFLQGGIDYVTAARGDSRSWRWADLQTLSEPDPYHLFVFGYRDTFTFDLKAPLSGKLLDWATDEIFAHNQTMNAPASASVNEPASGATGGHHE